MTFYRKQPLNCFSHAGNIIILLLLVEFLSVRPKKEGIAKAPMAMVIESQCNIYYH